MKFVAISDTHCRHHVLRLPRADAIIHAGDISYRGRESEVTDFLSWFSKLHYTYKIFIAGNHDFYFEKNPLRVQKIVPEGVIYLNDSGVDINGVKIWGSPVTPQFFNWAFNRQRGEALRRHWGLIPADTDVLITHGPPYGILDTTVASQQHAGCRDLLQTVGTIRPKAHVFGHIHESYGVVKRNGIQYINASLVNEMYELVNRPVVFEV